MAQARKRRKPPQNRVIKPEIEAPGGGGGGNNTDKDFKLWKSRVDSARKRREEWESRFHVERLAQFFLGEQNRLDPEMKVYNKFEATIETMVPNVFLTAPKFFVRPKPGRSTPTEERQAAVGEGLLTAIGDQDQNLKKAVRLGLQQAFFRPGVLKVVYDPRLVPNPRAGEPMYSERTRTNPQTGEPERIPLLEGKSRKALIEPDEILDDETYRYEWVDSRHMLFPDAGPDRKKWPWIGEEIETTLEEAKDDPAFASKKSRLKSNHRKTETSAVQPQLGHGEDPDTEMFIYCEIWDLVNREHKIIADGQDFKEFLVDEPLPAGIEDHPYSLLCAKPITDPEPCAWPKPITFSWMDLQDEYNMRRYQTSQGANGSARKIYYDDNTFPDADEAQKALGSARDMEAVKILDTNRPPVQSTDANLNAIILQDLQLLNADWQMVTGTTPSELFGVGGNSETAFEAGLVQRQADARDAMLADQVQDWLAEAGRKMLQRVKATMTIGMWVQMREYKDPEIANIAQRLFNVSPEQLDSFPQIKESLRQRFGQIKFRRISRSELIFDADVSVVPGSARPVNTSQERRILIELIKIFGAFPGILTVPELTKRVLKAFDMEDDLLAEQLQLAAKNLVEINARQAGRDQGGADMNAPGNAIQAILANGGLAQ